MRTLTIGLGLLLVLGACTSDPQAPPSSSAAAPATHKPAPRVPDRDEDAVLATLASVDPCKLVDRTGAAAVKLRDPHLCLLDFADGALTQIEFADRASHTARYALPTKEIGGAKIDAVDAGSDEHACKLEIPVSFDYAVQLRSLPGADTNTCGVADKYAAQVIAKLGTLGKVRHPAATPGLSKAACTVLDGAYGADLTPTQSADDLDTCWRTTPQGTVVRLSLLMGTGQPGSPWGTKWATIGGKAVYLGSSKCQLTWSDGTSSGQNLWVSVDFGEGCKLSVDTAKKLVPAVTAQLARPQQPVAVDRLTYRADEPDEPNPGACVDLPEDQCEPYQPTPVPAGVAPATQAAKADPNVACAAVVDAVHAQFPALRPVVGGTCAFVEPDHTVQLDLQIGTDVAPVDTPVTTRKLTLGGRPAEHFDYRPENRPPSTKVCVDSGQEDAFWCLTATFRPPRQQPTAQVDTSSGVKLEPVMAAVAAAHLR